jgi:hypothetical protein
MKNLIQRYVLHTSLFFSFRKTTIFSGKRCDPSRLNQRLTIRDSISGLYERSALLEEVNNGDL